MIGRLLQERQCSSFMYRSAEDIALDAVTVILMQFFRLRLAFDPFGHDRKIESVRHINDRADKVSLDLIAQYAIDEGLIHFQGVDGQATEIGEGGVASAEVVQSDSDAECSQFNQF